MHAPALAAAECRARGPFPDPDWPAAPAATRAARAAAIDALERYAFAPAGPDAAREGVRTDGLLVIHRGQVAYERYGRGYGPGTRHIGWSVTKSVTSALAGALALHGLLAPEDSICAHLPAPVAHCEITVRHLLEFASGLEWRETYEGRARQASSVLAMLYGVGRHDQTGFVLSHPRRAPAGVRWAYSSGDSLLLAAVMGAAAEPRLGREWPWKLLFEPLGMESAVFERDPRGALIGSSHFYATPRDLARLGWLYLNDGCWRGRRLLAEGWVEASLAVSAPLRAGSPHRHPGDVQGWAWWLNRPVPELGQPAPWPELPEDAFLARGHWGQFVVVIPSLEMVIVRTGDDRDEAALDLGRLFALAMAAGRLP